MGETIFQTHITKVGGSAADFLAENMLIFFQEDAPAYLADFCYLLAPGEGNCDGARPEDALVLGQTRFPITAIGDVALENFRTLRHLTVRFDGCEEAAQPGTMHVEQGKIPPLTAGLEVRLVKASDP